MTSVPTPSACGTARPWHLPGTRSPGYERLTALQNICNQAGHVKVYFEDFLLGTRIGRDLRPYRPRNPHSGEISLVFSSSYPHIPVAGGLRPTAPRRPAGCPALGTWQQDLRDSLRPFVSGAVDPPRADLGASRPCPKTSASRRFLARWDSENAAAAEGVCGSDQDMARQLGMPPVDAPRPNRRCTSPVGSDAGREQKGP